MQLISDWQRSKTKLACIAASVAVIAAAAGAALLCQKYGIRLAGHELAGIAMLPGALLPLVFSRPGSSVRAAAKGSKRAALATLRSDGLSEARGAQADIIELRRKNELLTKELRDLRVAYAELAIEAADRSEAIDRLNFLAYHDALTALPNRALLMDRLAQAVAFAQRAGTGVLVVYLDLDHFKMINDTMGHAAGDRVLTEIAARIDGCMRESDTASRVGGDEFVLVYTTTDGVRDAARIEARLLRAIAAPIEINGEAVVIGASLGMSLYPRDGTDPAQLIDAADAHMYSAKAARR